MRKLFFFFLSIVNFLYSQDFLNPEHCDSLKGMQPPPRSNYDVIYYHLTVKIEPELKKISGNNLIIFNTNNSLKKIRIDLYKNMKVEKILYKQKELFYERKYDAVFIEFPETLNETERDSIRIYFSGKPKEAENPPWDGGIVWSKDSSGYYWSAIAVQGEGASLWFPNKDQHEDEPDSVLISIISPAGLTAVSNGRLKSKEEIDKDWTIYNWFVSYPINNYNITFYLGNYKHFNDIFSGQSSFPINYYVLPYNFEKAKKHFKDVKNILECFENYFGPYPFPQDGYKLVEAPYLGMEHQSAIAYGNNYLHGYSGVSLSKTGLKFDHIIVHETAHEWWGNSVTAKDPADWWIHEGFATYAEALFVEYNFGYKESLKYLTGLQSEVKNDRPVIGVYNSNNEGSSDMYPKGALMLNTLRHTINNDELWFNTIKSFAEEYKYRTTSTDELVIFFNEKLAENYTYFFDQYLRYSGLPTLELYILIKGDSTFCRFRWKSDVINFRMPVMVTVSDDEFDFIYPSEEWQIFFLNNIDPENFKIAEDKFFINTDIKTLYLDENLE